MIEKQALPRWTWILPLLIFHSGTVLSLGFRISPGASLCYLPVPLGMILIHWWGPRVLVGLYLNAMLCAGYWGLERWWLWPAYAIPETLAVALSWWLFHRMFKGMPWLPNLPQTWKFLVFGIIVPCGLAAPAGRALLTLTGDSAPGSLIHITYAGFVLDILGCFALTVPVLLFATSWMEKRGLSLTRGAFPRPALVSTTGSNRILAYQAVGIALALPALCLFVPFNEYWFVYGALMIGSALRFGIGAAALASAWTILLTLPLSALFRDQGGGPGSDGWLSRSEPIRMNMNLATLSFAALVVGRALSDLFLEIGRRAKVEEDLRKSISEWERMRTSVREGEDKYRILFESSSDAIIVGENGIVIECNDRALEMYGGARETFLGLSVTRLFPEKLADGRDAAAVIASYRRAAMAGVAQFFEWRGRRLDGSAFDTEMTFVGVTLEGKRVVMAVIRDITMRKEMERAIHENERATIRDISDRKRIERALIESEERFRQMAENIQEVFFLLDCAEEKVLYLSPLARSILGVPVPEMSSRPMSFIDRMHPEDADRIGLFRDSAWRRQSFNEDFRFIRPDGETRWLRLRSFLIRDVEGAAFRVAGVIGDITEYKRAQEESRAHQQRLVQSDKMNSLGRMVSGVAHEINNPNNLIMLNADVMETFWRHMRPVLREHVSGNPDWKLAGIPYGVAEGKFETLLGGVSGGAKRIKRIVDNLKDFARSDGGDMADSVSVEKVVDASVAIVENLIRKSTDRFSLDNAEELPRIRGNFQKLEQVVINLVTNACQALENRSKAVRIATWYDRDAGMVAIRVEDEGRGIPSELLNKVADPFFTTKRDTGGTGLGLSVSYGIVREHRGRMEFRSDASRGTTVEIRIPTIKESAKEIA